MPRDFYARDSRVVAPALLNKLLVRREKGLPLRVARIVEVEAYCGGEDPGSHAFRGPTPRNEVMFGRAGHLYVYFTYGMHWCANAVCGDEGEGTAVLLRAGAPIAGMEVMQAARAAARVPRDLLSGPAKLCQAFSIDGSHNGTDVTRRHSPVVIGDDGTPPPRRPGVSERIGLSAGADLLWRWYVSGDHNLSRRGST